MLYHCSVAMRVRKYENVASGRGVCATRVRGRRETSAEEVQKGGDVSVPASKKKDREMRGDKRRNTEQAYWRQEKKKMTRECDEKEKQGENVSKVGKEREKR